MIQIADLKIPIANASLDLLLYGDQLIWGFTIDAGPFKRGDVDWPRCRVDSAGIFTTESGTLSSWTDLGQVEVEWENLKDNDEVPHAMIYLFEHELIQNGVARMETRDSAIHLELSGVCNIYYDEKYNVDLPLSLNAELQLKQIMCGRDSKDECFAQLSQHFSPKLFSYRQDEHGVSMLVPINAG